MNNVKIGSLMLALGLVLGSGTTVALHSPTIAAAAEAMSMGKSAMNMTSKSPADRDLNAAMDRMSDSMKTTKLTGVVDRDFMLMMIPHHRSAVDMAKIELRRGTHPELKALARDIVASQTGEIGQMNAWLEKWYGAR